ncbi:MAG: hypothetical protein LC107_00760 [Chitinophagales bacterium]|nr:hypothetical protein [Chitinophagales bacterium]
MRVRNVGLLGQKIYSLVSPHGLSDDVDALHIQKTAGEKGRNTLVISQRCQTTDHSPTTISRSNNGRRNHTDVTKTYTERKRYTKTVEKI